MLTLLIKNFKIVIKIDMIDVNINKFHNEFKYYILLCLQFSFPILLALLFVDEMENKYILQ